MPGGSGVFTPCTSPYTAEGLAEGPHRFEVRARDPAGNVSEPATVEWMVVRAEVSLGDGAWSWFADPRALHVQGRTFVGWVARDGDVKVSAYDHATRSRTTALVAPAVERDDHANPALQVLPDGRLRVFYSAHGGTTMSYRSTLRPYDVTSWDPPRTMPSNTPGSWGYTYPNPVHLAAEATTYLFWRGGNFNPTYATQPDASDAWSPARTLISAPGRPYVKVDSDGEDTIHFAFTNAHPNEAADVNIHYAAYRDGALWRADGTRIGPLGTAITPQQADRVYDTGRKAWVHDVAIDGDGRPVIVFASFAATSDHRYMYARWTGTEWVVHELTAAGGSISDDGKEPFYSGGLTLDHEDPSHGLPVAAGRRQLRDRDLDDRGRRGDVDVEAGHRAVGRQERPAGLPARAAPVLERSQRRLDARRVRQLHRLPHVDHDAAADGRPRAADRRRRGVAAQRARAAGGRVRRSRLGRRCGLRLGLRRRNARAPAPRSVTATSSRACTSPS